MSALHLAVAGGVKAIIAGTGSLAMASFTEPTYPYSLTAATGPAYSDWYVPGQDGSGVAPGKISRKTGANLIVDNGVFGDMAFGIATYAAPAGGNLQATTADATGTPNGYSAGMDHSTAQAVVITNSANQSGWSFTFPAPTGATKKVRIWAGTYSPNYVFNATLSDASATAADFVCQSSGNNFLEVTFKAASAGQTLTVKLQKAAAGSTMTGSRDASIFGVAFST